MFNRPLSAITLAAALLLGGCAVTRSTLDIQVPGAANPPSGHAYRLVATTDLRAFELDPRKASTPSLKYGEIDDPTITQRAIARKRNGFGAAMGDYLLPEGRKVADIVEETLTRALRESGARVLQPSDPRYSAAAPVSAQIQQFWAWATPGWAMHLEFRVRLRVEGLPGVTEVSGTLRRGTMAATDNEWRLTIEGGLEALNDDLRAQLSRPRPEQVMASPDPG